LTHLAIEPIVIATHRRLSSVHPLYKLMIRHFKWHLAIVALGRADLMSPTGAIAESSPMTYEGIFDFGRVLFRKWRFDKSSLPGILKENGLIEPLPGYYYQQDGLLLWNTLHSLVSDIVHIYYKDDATVQKDSEIQNWADEIYHNGFPMDVGFPSSVTSREQLIELVSTIIFTPSVQHAALNFKQFESFGFIPFAPGAMFAPPPGHKMAKVTKGKLTEEDILKALPPRSVGLAQVGMINILSSFSAQDQTLGKNPEELFVEKEALAAFSSFQKKLEEIETKIRKRGDWTWLAPSRIPNSAAI